jgi:hypothetical protein
MLARHDPVACSPQLHVEWYEWIIFVWHMVCAPCVTWLGSFWPWQ